MKRALLSLVFLGGCLPASKDLLCRTDSSCKSDEQCELISGLCKPKPVRSGFAMGMGTAGSAGKLDCPILESPSGDAGLPPGLVGYPALATVTTAGIVDDPACGADVPSRVRQAYEQGTTPLQATCSARRFQARLLGAGGTPIDLMEVTVDQIDRAPNDPVARLRLIFRAPMPGMFSAPADLHAVYSERCGTAITGASLVERHAASQGSMTIQSIDGGRLKASFDVDLVQLVRPEARGFGRRCTLPRICNGGCAAQELITPECSTGVCLPAQMDPTGATGFCAGICDTSGECGEARDPSNYCYLLPGQEHGQCIRLCKPSATDCPADTSCRPRGDFPNEIAGEEGPPRCLDTCLPTRSTPDVPASCGASPRPDGGVAMDATPRPDGGLAMDATPRPDGGRADTGAPDSGAPDSGAPAAGSFGQPCTVGGAPCAAMHFCGALDPASTTAGFCTRTCTAGTGDAMCRAGYVGPGTPFCRQGVRDLATSTPARACAFACAGDMLCPGNMICEDRVNNTTRMPPPDGVPESCEE